MTPSDRLDLPALMAAVHLSARALDPAGETGTLLEAEAFDDGWFYLVAHQPGRGGDRLVGRVENAELLAAGFSPRMSTEELAQLIVQDFVLEPTGPGWVSTHPVLAAVQRRHRGLTWHGERPPM